MSLLSPGWHRSLLLVTLLLPTGCRAAEAPPPPPPLPLVHWPVPPPEPLTAANPVLWVALSARLGPPPAAAASAPPLRLRSSGGSLVLIDAAGRRFTAPELVLHWRRELLTPPVTLRRQVLGPFASFESAEQAALEWRSRGVAAEIAKPQDWEVWAPAGAAEPSPLPEGLRVRPVNRLESERVGLELRRAQGVVSLKGPIRIEAPGGLLWKQGVYAGPFRLQADAHGGWTLVEQVPLERYLQGVVPHEIGAGVPPSALQAQAVLARTWAVRNQHRFAVDGYHLCADTQCQVYSDPRQAGPAVRQAIAATRLAVLMAADRPIHAVYHASNGGISAGYEEAWSGPAVAYLRSFADGPTPFPSRFPLPLKPSALATLLQDGRSAWGADHPTFRWRRMLTASQVSAALGKDRGVGMPTALKVLERGPSGRVLALEVQGSEGRRILRLDAIRRTLRSLPSTLFVLKSAGPGVWELEGGGFGHGAGLSQAGAIDQARRGWSARRILEHYYPGTELMPLGAPGHSP